MLYLGFPNLHWYTSSICQITIVISSHLKKDLKSEDFAYPFRVFHSKSQCYISPTSEPMY